MTDDVQLACLESAAERAYDAMYEARSPGDATARYSDAKQALYTAIGLAHNLGRPDLEQRLTERLARVKAVFRSQFCRAPAVGHSQRAHSARAEPDFAGGLDRNHSPPPRD